MGGSAWSTDFTRLLGIFTTWLHNDGSFLPGLLSRVLQTEIVPDFFSQKSHSHGLFFAGAVSIFSFLLLLGTPNRGAVTADVVVVRNLYTSRRVKEEHHSQHGGTKKKKLSRGSLSVNEKRTDFSLLIALHILTHTHIITHTRTHTQPNAPNNGAYYGERDTL